MKVHAIHDAKGNITRLVLRPEDGPPGGPAPTAGHFATEVDTAGLKIDAKDPKNYERLIDTMRRCHDGIPLYLRGPAAMFWVFHVVRDYGHTLEEGKSRHVPRLQSQIMQMAVPGIGHENIRKHQESGGLQGGQHFPSLNQKPPGILARTRECAEARFRRRLTEKAIRRHE